MHFRLHRIMPIPSKYEERNDIHLFNHYIFSPVLLRWESLFEHNSILFLPMVSLQKFLKIAKFSGKETTKIGKTHL